ncbi:MAG: ankyrin repeat domain-containing protein [Proteobacteria bacterium]|nr:ankyrin repeat domain-containing protein [Pseudomonadota bacterium]
MAPEDSLNPQPSQGNLFAQPSMVEVTVFHEAITMGDTTTVISYLNKYRKNEIVNVHNSLGVTALMKAAMGGNNDIITLLLERGADIDLQNRGNDRATALMYAVLFDHKDTVMLLLDKGADINAHTSHDWTALMYSARGGHDGILTLLLTRGADSTAKNHLGQTALELAQAGYSAKAEAILQQWPERQKQCIIRQKEQQNAEAAQDAAIAHLEKLRKHQSVKTALKKPPPPKP